MLDVLGCILGAFGSVVDKMTMSDWILVAVVISAFFVPYVAERIKYKFYRPNLVLRFNFGRGSPCSHQHIARSSGVIDYPVYYFSFSVTNEGRRQADDCKALLEQVWELRDPNNLIEWPSFSPVNLKWSGEDIDTGERAWFKTIYPYETVFCDIGKIEPREHQRESKYARITHQERDQHKFFFEIRRHPWVQRDFLVPGRYRIRISVYGKNAPKRTVVFEVHWSGEWKDTEGEMFDGQIVISLHKTE